MIHNPEALRLLYPDPVYLADLFASCERRGFAQMRNLRAKNGEIRNIMWTHVLPERSRKGRWE